MTLDAPLVAAATLRRSRGIDPRLCAAADVTHQLQLAHVLLDRGFDGVAALGEALAGGDRGLGTVDRLDGELVIVDAEPWRVDWHGVEPVPGRPWADHGDPAFFPMTPQLRVTEAGAALPFADVATAALEAFLLDHYPLPRDAPTVARTPPLAAYLPG